MDGWTELGARKPTEADADAQKCVLVWHALSGAMIYNIYSLGHNCFLTHWMSLPGAPEGTRDAPGARGAGAEGGDHRQVPGLQ